MSPNDDRSMVFRTRTVEALGLVVRQARIEAGLSQSELAMRSGVGRQWVNEFEAGKESAEVGLVLRVVEALGLHVLVAANIPAGEGAARAVNLDEIEHDDG